MTLRTLKVLALLPAVIFLVWAGNAPAHTQTIDKRGTCQVWNLDGHNHNDVMHASNAPFSGCPLAFNDTMRGLFGNDTIFTYSGNDEVWGGEGADALNSGAGNDVVYGGNGNDTIDCGSGADEAWGGGGTDTFVNCDGNAHQ